MSGVLVSLEMMSNTVRLPKGDKKGEGGHLWRNNSKYFQTWWKL